MSNVDRSGRAAGTSIRPAGGAPPAPRARVLVPPTADRTPHTEFPSAAGTAVLNLTSDQIARIRILLVALRSGKSSAEAVRRQIFGLLSGGQRRVAGAAWFILSVRA